MHHDLGQPLAVNDPALHDLETHELLKSLDHPLWVINLLLGDKRYAAKRHLHHGAFEDLWLMYCAMEPAEDPASRSTLYRVLRESRHRYFFLRNIGLGSRCTTCAQPDEKRVQATTSEARTAVIAKQNVQHQTCHG